jgi:DNA (cytosine-5)-methyltransferase 1
VIIGDCFSGIGGFSLAAERAGLAPAWQIEKDAFCRRVLAKHWPVVERHEDIRAVDPAGLQPVDILCGGWPCQGNSIAGKRQGHADERSGLFSELLHLVGGMDTRPRFLLLENVPGLVSVNGGRDFACCINELRRRGYVGCVRRLDAQYFGLAQRRRRLFFVCGLGAAGQRAVRLVLEGGERHPAPRQEAGQTASTLLGSGAGGERPAGTASEIGFLVYGDQGAPAGRALAAKGNWADPTAETYVVRTGQTGAGGDNLWKDRAPTLASSNDLPVVAFNWQSGGDVRLGVADLPGALSAGQVPAVANCLSASYGKAVQKMGRSADHEDQPAPAAGSDGDLSGGWLHEERRSGVSVLRRLTPT